MRKIKLLVLLSILSLQPAPIAQAQDAKHPELKRHEKPSTSTDEAGRWDRGQSREGARDRRLQRVEWPAEDGGSGRGLTERDRRNSAGREVDRAARWSRSRSERARELRPTDRPQLLTHIFRGDVRNGRASGFHYEGTGMEATYGTKVTEGTRTPPDEHGVYRAKVEVRGVVKDAESTFFPRSWSRAEVIKSINEAYSSRALVGKAPNYFQGTSSSGVKVGMYVNKFGEVVTAYPLYEGKKD